MLNNQKTTEFISNKQKEKGLTQAVIDLSKLKPLPIFSYIQKMGNIDEEEMW